MPIIIAPYDRELRVVKLLADGKTRKHLENLGITVNSSLKILSNSGGNIICQVKESRLALDKEVASKIIVA